MFDIWSFALGGVIGIVVGYYGCLLLGANK